MKARDALDYIGMWDEADPAITALLAATPAGEGVYIAPDGELWRVVDGDDDCWKDHYIFVPIEEATE